MSATRLVWAGKELAAGEWLLPADVSHHARVTRLTTGDPLEVLDLEGAVSSAVLIGWEGKHARVRVESTSHGRGEPPGPLVVGLGILHTQSFDWAVEKLTEMGVTLIVPILCTRVQGRSHEARVERWQRLAESAVAQCGRARAPRVAPPTALSAFLAAAPGTRLVADPLAAGCPTTVRAEALSIAIGPEGGLTREECAALAAAGLAPLGLGPRTLRAETAAVAAVAVACAGAGWS